MSKSNDINERIKAYEGLVISTVRYWRPYITKDLDDDDIAQELRIKVLKALTTFDPSIGYPERKHVFGAVRNRIKDLVAKRKREYETVELDEEHFGDYVDDHKTHAISSLKKEQQDICILLTQGYNHMEIMRMLGLSTTAFQNSMKVIKTSLNVWPGN